MCKIIYYCIEVLKIAIVYASPISLRDLMAIATQPSLKHLSASGLISSLPSIYISRNSDPEVVVEEEIPVIDLSLLRGTTEERAQAVRDLGRACQEWGFFMVVNHGLPEGVMSDILRVYGEFFDLTDEDKAKYTKKKLMDPIQCGSGFNAAAEDVSYWRDFLKMIVHPEFYCPDEPPSFRDILREYTTYVRQIVREILKGIWESLELDISSMDEALDLDSCFQLIATNLYPPCPQPELAFGLPPHSDFGLLTLLLTNGIDGLEVKHNGRWVNVKSLPNSFFINTGDHMEIVSNGRYKSVLHRAALNKQSTRMSIVIVTGPSMETIVAPAPELVIRDDHQPRYRAMKFWDYVLYQQDNKLNEKSVLDRVRLPV